MRALVKTDKIERSLEIMEVSIPDITDNEVLVQVVNVAVCGSDLHLYEYTAGYDYIQTPLIIGHEFSGYIKEVGSNVKEFKVGDRVVGESNLYCNQCENCMDGLTHICLNAQMTGIHIDGALAEYIAVPTYSLHHIPESLSFAEGAIAQPISVSLNAVFDNCKITPGDHVVVFGPGIQGLIAAQAARIQGAIKVGIVGTEIDEKIRLPIAREMDFTTWTVEEGAIHNQIKNDWGIEKVDVVLDASGSTKAVETGLNLLKRGGRFTALGIYSDKLTVDLTKMVRSEITFHTSYTSRWKHYEQALALLASGKINVKPLIRYYDFNDSIQAFEDGLTKDVMKPVLSFNR